MTNEASPMLKYYPLEFELDQDGKKNPWEAVVILPFIDETDLVTAEAQYCHESKLSEAEKKRKTDFRYRESNPGLLGESQLS